MPNMTREECKACVGKGWSGLIDEIYDKLPEDAYIHQIKEKFSLLRVYIDNVPDSVQDFIYECEKRSAKICEDCGKPGKLRGGGWVLTLCDKCNADKERRLP
jgi:hypothetical protein